MPITLASMFPVFPPDVGGAAIANAYPAVNFLIAQHLEALLDHRMRVVTEVIFSPRQISKQYIPNNCKKTPASSPGPPVWEQGTHVVQQHEDAHRSPLHTQSWQNSCAGKAYCKKARCNQTWPHLSAWKQHVQGTRPDHLVTSRSTIQTRFC